MNIRPATAADVPAVAKMVDKLAAVHEQWDAARYDYKANVGDMYLRWLTARAEDSNSVFLVAEHERLRAERPFLAGFIVGTIEKPIPIYRIERFGFIHDLWVDEAYRHEGVGRQMTMLAIERFGAMGVKQVRLETAAANDVARTLFESCGFRVATVEMLMEIMKTESHE
jgi:ribosomal protein S18 acetylase RimI-like enzyme